MVNYGVSRACETCKKRRKKCDETRPACLRCVRSRRPCPGYKDDTSLFFRHYGPADSPSTPTLERWRPSTDSMLEATSLDIFLHNLMVQSQDRTHSRGFLDGMNYLFATSPPTSPLMSAAKIVILSSLANRYKRDSLVPVVRKQYGQLLKDYNTALSRETGNLSIEHFFTAVLLGLYEIVASDSVSPTRYLVHVKGLASILEQGITSTSPTSNVGIYSPGTHLVTKGAITQTHQQGPGILCPPIDDTQRRSMDSIIVKLSPLSGRAERLLAQSSPPKDELLDLQQDLLGLDNEISYWAYDRPLVWRPEHVDQVPHNPSIADQATFYYPGLVDKYFDVYVATAWNSWRAAHVVYLDHLFRVAEALGQHELVPVYKERADPLSAAFKASIPYHLSRDVGEYIQHAHAGVPLAQSDRLVGGLLLLHPLWAFARCTIVDELTREYALNTLRWIGSEMGIRQATILADSLQTMKQGSSTTQSSGVSFIDGLEGHFLITASMMLEPRKRLDPSELKGLDTAS
ncbi:hypothetical protein F53441_3249 [Fusarium austroafricanum]|uniref:Zn(2)-C6 fungal-type domain-containing protein n=1 Tax=Fusarium austroafricanum TaxID=2364996 RepID=A0A8H4KR73_9HYPO|nr:hypothetical protein F53441_3249 [Fusarium austroafricanum]